MEAVYMVGQDKQKRVAGIGDVVMAPGNLRGIVIGEKGTFVTVLAIGTSKQTGDTFVLTPRYIHDFPAEDCQHMEKQSRASHQLARSEAFEQVSCQATRIGLACPKPL